MSVVQLAFDMSVDPVYRWENYFISSSNSEVITWVRQWPRWRSRALIVCGPQFSGKTHVAHLWRSESKACFAEMDHIQFEDLARYVEANPFLIIEDINQRVDETKLLHLYNLIQEHEGYILFTTNTPPSHWNIKLSDLDSRLKAIPLVTIQQPDDELLKALMIKRFSDCQLRVPERVVNYLSKHMERSYEAVEILCSSLDRQSLEQKRGLTLPFAREVLLLK
jgi:chromosomal replication initiation ATPase DnaA